MANVPSKFKLLESAQFSALIGKIGRTQATLTADVQTAAVNAVAHAILHGNVEPARQLYGAMGKSVRKDSLLAWIEEHGPMYWAKTDRAIKYDPSRKAKFTWSDEQAEVLLGTPWNTAIRQPDEVSKFDIDTMFDKFLAKCRDIAKKAESDKNIKVSNIGLIAVLAEASNKYYDATHKTGAPAPRVSKREKAAKAISDTTATVAAQARAEKFNERYVAPTLPTPAVVNG